MRRLVAAWMVATLGATPAASAAPRLIIHDAVDYGAISRRALKVLYARCPLIEGTLGEIGDIEVWPQFSLPGTPPAKLGFKYYLAIALHYRHNENFVPAPIANTGSTLSPVFYLGAGPTPGIAVRGIVPYTLCGLPVPFPPELHLIPVPALRFLSGLDQSNVK